MTYEWMLRKYVKTYDYVLVIKRRKAPYSHFYSICSRPSYSYTGFVCYDKYHLPLDLSHASIRSDSFSSKEEVCKDIFQLLNAGRSKHGPEDRLFIQVPKIEFSSKEDLQMKLSVMGVL